MVTFATMTRKEYNRKWLDGDVDQSFLELRENNLINLECDNPRCRGHIQICSEDIEYNCYSAFQMSVCAICLDAAGVRVGKGIKLHNQGYFSILKFVKKVLW